MSRLCTLLALAFTSSLFAQPPPFFPTPQKAKWGGYKVVAKAFRVEAGEDVPLSIRWEVESHLRGWGFSPGEGGLVFSLSLLPIKRCEDSAIPPYQQGTAVDNPALQTYFLKVAVPRVEIGACGEAGFFYALQTVKHLLRHREQATQIMEGEVTDYPAFPIRGLFEGGYGIWDDEGRLRIMDWMGESKLNSYLYGPKSDPKIRRRWRALYDDVEIFNFKRQIERCRRNHIYYGYTIAPVLGMEYGSDEDFQTLLRKVRQIQSLGVKTFVLAFDDTLGTMYHPRDHKRFENLGEAEAYLANKLYAALKAYDQEVVLAMVPELYAGVFDMPYTRSLVEKLDPKIFIGWTGWEIVAPKIDPPDMRAFIDFYGRMPSLGDNWGTIYPLVGRHPDLHKYTNQFLVNPYNLQGEVPIPGMAGASEPELMPIQGAAVAEYAWNPQGYDPDQVVARLAEAYFRPEARALFKLQMLREFYRFRSMLKTDYEPAIVRRLAAVLDGEDKQAIEKAIAELLPSLQQAVSQADLLIGGGEERAIGSALARRIGAAREDYQKGLAILDRLVAAIKNEDEKVRRQAADELLGWLRSPS